MIKNSSLLYKDSIKKHNFDCQSFKAPAKG